MRYILLAIGLMSAAHEVAGQDWVTRSHEPIMPDSTYLALTLEMPSAGTFYVTRHAMRRLAGAQGHNNEQVRDFFYLDRVEIVGCQLVYHHRTGGSRVQATKTIVPLKQVNAETIRVRQLSGATLEFPPWEIHAMAADRSERPFQFSNRGSTSVRRHNEFSIPIVDRERAYRFAALLKDGADRCESWNTSPIAPVR